MCILCILIKKHEYVVQGALGHTSIYLALLHTFSCIQPPPPQLHSREWSRIEIQLQSQRAFWALCAFVIWDKITLLFSGVLWKPINYLRGQIFHTSCTTLMYMPSSSSLTVFAHLRGQLLLDCANFLVSSAPVFSMVSASTTTPGNHFLPDWVHLLFHIV